MPGIRKLYYSIREVGELTELKPHVLRYWEGEFPQLRPKKNRAGNRAYTDADIEVVRQIQALLRDDKYTIEGARQVLDRGEAGADPEPAAGEETGTAEPGAGAPLAAPAAGPPLPRAELESLRAFLADVLRGL